MTIETVSSTYTNSYQTNITDTTQDISNIDSQEFMTILLAQLQNQNPLDPVDDTEFMAQIAQMNSLQELSSIKQKIGALVTRNDALYASNLIGKTVKAETENGEEIEGVVTETFTELDECYLTIGDFTVALASVLGIIEAPETQQA